MPKERSLGVLIGSVEYEFAMYIQMKYSDTLTAKVTPWFEEFISKTPGRLHFAWGYTPVSGYPITRMG